MQLSGGRSFYIELPAQFVARDRDGSVLIKPAGVQYLDKVRALAMRSEIEPSAAFITSARHALGVTQPQFARRLHKSTITIKRWEAGTLRPGADSVRRLRQVLGRAAKRGVVLGS